MLLCCRFPLPTLAERRAKVQLQPDRGGTIGQIPSAAAAAIALALLRLALVFAFFGAWQRCGWVAGHKTPPQSSQAQGQWAYVNVLHGRQRQEQRQRGRPRRTVVPPALLCSSPWSSVTS